MTEQTPFSEISVVINKRIGEHTPLRVGSTDFFDKFGDAGEKGKPAAVNPSVQIAQRIAEIDKSPMMPHDEWVQMWDEERERRLAPPEEPVSDDIPDDDEQPEEEVAPQQVDTTDPAHVPALFDRLPDGQPVAPTPDVVQDPDDILDIVLRPVSPVAIPAAPLVPAPPVVPPPPVQAGAPTQQVDSSDRRARPTSRTEEIPVRPPDTSYIDRLAEEARARRNQPVVGTPIPPPLPPPTAPDEQQRQVQQTTPEIAAAPAPTEHLFTYDPAAVDRTIRNLAIEKGIGTLTQGEMERVQRMMKEYDGADMSGVDFEILVDVAIDEMLAEGDEPNEPSFLHDPRNDPDYTPYRNPRSNISDAALSNVVQGARGSATDLKTNPDSAFLWEDDEDEPPPTTTPSTPDAQPTDPIEIHREILEQARKDYYKAIETEAPDIEDKRKAYQKEQREHVKILFESENYKENMENSLDYLYPSGENAWLESHFHLGMEGFRQKILALGDGSDRSLVDECIEMYDIIEGFESSQNSRSQTYYAKDFIQSLIGKIDRGMILGRENWGESVSSKP